MDNGTVRIDASKVTPAISIDYDWEGDTYTLVATSFLRTEPAGPRLYRGGDFPAIAFVHDNKAGAEQDAALLQTYCTLAWAGKAPKAKGREEKEEVKLTKWDFANAVWNC